jgi:hypothetical protein
MPRRTQREKKMRKKKNEFTWRSFESLEDLNRQVAQWLATINVKAGLVPDKPWRLKPARRRVLHRMVPKGGGRIWMMKRWPKD